MDETPKGKLDPRKLTLPEQVRFERSRAYMMSDLIPIGYDMDPAILRIRNKEFWKQITLIKLESIRQIIAVHDNTINRIMEETHNLPSEQFLIP